MLGGNYTQRCVVSTSSNLPDVSSTGLTGVAEYGFQSCDSRAVPALATATSLRSIYSPTCAPGINGMTGYYKFLCGDWGLAQLLYTDSACTNLTQSIALSDSFNQCLYSRQMYVCLTPAPLPPTLTPQMCKGSAVPTPLPTASLKCSEGGITSAGISYTGVQVSTGPFTMCYSFTYSCSKETIGGGYFSYCDANTSSVRLYGGVSAGTSVVALLTSLKQQGRRSISDVSLCTTTNCNSPSTEACPIPSPPYTTLACPASAPPNPINALAPIACYSNIPDGGLPQLQAAPVNITLNCAAFTVNCLALNKTWWSFSTAYSSKLLKACGTNSVIRAYSGAYRGLRW